MEEIRDLFPGHARKEGGVRNLVAVQVQDGQNRAIRDGVEELVALPGGGQRPGFSLAVADGDRRDQTGIVKHGAESMGNAVTQLTAFIDRARRFRRAMAGYAAREGELLEQLLHTRFIL